MGVGLAQRALGEAPHCGDQGSWWSQGERTVLCLADGLGHGPFAERAARAALHCVGNHLSQPLEALFAHCDRALRKTRGVALGVAVIEEPDGKLVYAAVGNLRAWVVGRRSLKLNSNYGIIGGGYRSLTPETATLKPGHLLIMATDGLPEHIEVARQGPLEVEAGELAHGLLERWAHGRDDAAVLVYKKEASR